MTLSKLFGYILFFILLFFLISSGWVHYFLWDYGRTKDAPLAQAEISLRKTFEYYWKSSLPSKFKLLKAAKTGGRDSSDLYLLQFQNLFDYESFKDFLNKNIVLKGCKSKYEKIRDTLDSNDDRYLSSYPSWWRPSQLKELEFFDLDCRGHGIRLFFSQEQCLMYIEEWSS